MRRLALGLAAVSLAASAALALSGPSAFASAGNTAKAPQVAAMAGTTQDPIATETDTSGTNPVTAGPNATYCRTDWHQKNGEDAVGVILAWYRMTTYWCWNFDIVTYHSTYVSGGVTTTGAAGGWSYNGTPDGIHFHCYVASGSNENCSGNQEEAQGQFRACIYGVCFSSWSPSITESENYNGYFFG